MAPSRAKPGELAIMVAKSVYKPAEDSYLLAVYASKQKGRILEIGCGSGIVSLSAAAAQIGNEVLGVDINPAAVECAQENAARNNIPNCRFLQSDLFSGVSGKFNVILFNPPYLPTEKGEQLADKRENAAYDGGISGTKTFLRFAKEAKSHLLPGGKMAVIATSLNNGIETTLHELQKRIGPARTIAEESFFFEKIALIEAVL